MSLKMPTEFPFVIAAVRRQEQVGFVLEAALGCVSLAAPPCVVALQMGKAHDRQHVGRRVGKAVDFFGVLAVLGGASFFQQLEALALFVGGYAAVLSFAVGSGGWGVAGSPAFFAFVFCGGHRGGVL
jgi:hypothetical protein